MSKKSPMHRSQLGKALLAHLATREGYATCRDTQLVQICNELYTGMLPAPKRLGTVLSELFAEGFLCRRSFSDTEHEVNNPYSSMNRKIYGYRLKVDTNEQKNPR